MIVLALDSAQNACSVAVADGDRILASITEPMQRGHQERVAPMVAEAMAQAGLSFDAVARIGVTVGPGSFTGLRVGLAFAKAMSLALDIPCIGVGTLEALAAGRSGAVAAVIDAKREQVYLQLFQDGAALTAPEVVEISAAASRLAQAWPAESATLVGSGLSLLTFALPQARVEVLQSPDVTALARLVQSKPLPDRRPQPLYLRAPDAKTIAERQAERQDAPA